MEEPQVIIIYKAYTEAQKRANKKYAEKNKDKLNNHMKNYYNKKKKQIPTIFKKDGINQKNNIIKKSCYYNPMTKYFN